MIELGLYRIVVQSVRSQHRVIYPDGGGSAPPASADSDSVPLPQLYIVSATERSGVPGVDRGEALESKDVPVGRDARLDHWSAVVAEPSPLDLRKPEMTPILSKSVTSHRINNLKNALGLSTIDNKTFCSIIASSRATKLGNVDVVTGRYVREICCDAAETTSQINPDWFDMCSTRGA